MREGSALLIYTHTYATWKRLQLHRECLSPPNSSKDWLIRLQLLLMRQLLSTARLLQTLLLPRIMRHRLRLQLQLQRLRLRQVQDRHRRGCRRVGHGS